LEGEIILPEAHFHVIGKTEVSDGGDYAFR
jgi:hypothetical protein